MYWLRPVNSSYRHYTSTKMFCTSWTPRLNRNPRHKLYPQWVSLQSHSCSSLLNGSFCVCASIDLKYHMRLNMILTPRTSFYITFNTFNFVKLPISIKISKLLIWFYGCSFDLSCPILDTEKFNFIEHLYIVLLCLST